MTKEQIERLGQSLSCDCEWDLCSCASANAIPRLLEERQRLLEAQKALRAALDADGVVVDMNAALELADSAIAFAEEEAK